MHGGIVPNDEYSQRSIVIDNCTCDLPPVIVWHYITGIANKIHYFVKCPVCRIRTKDRKNIHGAILDWNNKEYLYDNRRFKL
jgi:hypothetical protein